MQVLVDDLAINYQVVGSGPTILMLHGWGDSLSTFYDLRAELSKDYELVLLDLPGFGQSSHLSEAWSLQNYAAFLKDFLKKIKKDADYIIGHSNGSSIAIFAVGNGYLKPKKLVLMSSAGIRRTDVKQQAIKAIAKTGKVASSILPKKMKKNIRGRFYTAIGSDLLAVPHMQETYLEIIKTDVEEDAKKIKIPTILIYGADDKATPIEYGKIFNEAIKGSQLKIVDNGAHFVHRDQPIQVLRYIKEFLK